MERRTCNVKQNKIKNKGKHAKLQRYHHNRSYMHSLYTYLYVGHLDSSPEYSDCHQTLELQTRKIHQMETAIFIPPSKGASSSNLEMFFTDCSLDLETHLYTSL